MGRLFAFIFAALSVIVGTLAAVAPRLAPVLIRWADTNKVSGSDLTWMRQASLWFAEALTAYQLWFEAWGPWLFIFMGLLALLAALNWKTLEVFWNDHYGMALKIDYQNIANEPSNTGCPYVERKSIIHAKNASRAIIQSEFRIGIENNHPKNQTIRGVEVRVLYAGVPGDNIYARLHTMDGQHSVAINHGVSEFFVLGVANDIANGPVSIPTPKPEAEIEALEKQAQVHGLQMFVSNIDDRTGIVRVQPWMRNNQQPLILHISGENVRATYAVFRFDGREQTKVLFLKQSTKAFHQHNLPRKHFPNRVPRWDKKLFAWIQKGIAHVARKTPKP